jgi:outer membrane biosynthesis protein TonB
MRDRKGRTFCVSCEKSPEEIKKVAENPEPVQVAQQATPVEQPKISQAPQPQQMTQPDLAFNPSTTASLGLPPAQKQANRQILTLEAIDTEIMTLVKSTLYKAIRDINDRHDISNSDKLSLMLNIVDKAKHANIM